MDPKTLISWEDQQGCIYAYFEWAEAYDTKDWARLRKIVAPTLRVDYHSFLNRIWPEMPADDFVAMVSDPEMLGDPCLMTQHFCGATKWEKVSDTEIVGWHQMRVPHHKYTDATRTTVSVTGTAHSTNQHWYRKVEGRWYFAGLNPDFRWGDDDFDRVFIKKK